MTKLGSMAPVELARSGMARSTPNAVIRIWRVLWLMARRTVSDSVPGMASALAYQTLLGLIPVLVVVTLVAKTLTGAAFGPFVAGFVQSLGLDSMQIVPPSEGAANAKPVALGSWVETLVNQAANIDLSALGWIGVVVTVGSAIWLMTSIEMSFNRIYRARQGRGWLRRVVLYWFVLTASPLLLGGTLWLSLVLSDASDQPVLGWAVALVRNLWGIGMLWTLLFLVYLVVPAARVRAHCAAVGSFFAAAIIYGLKTVLTAYFAHAFGMSKLYGSLGLVPVFMFWLYVVWLVVLMGLEVSSITQTLRLRGLAAGEAADDGSFADPTALVAAMEEASKQWIAGTPATRDSIAVALGLDDRLAGEMLEALVGDGFLAHTDNDAYVPARAPATIRADEVLAAAFKRCAGDASVLHAPASAALRRAQLERAAAIDFGAAGARSDPS